MEFILAAPDIMSFRLCCHNLLQGCTERLTIRRSQKCAIPVISSDSLFGVMGSIAEYSAKLWDFLSRSVDHWSKEYYKANPGSGPQDFFRSHHARLRREIRNIVGNHSRP